MALYLVTGGAGFIGSHLVDALLARGDRVRVLDDLSTGRRDNLDPRAALTVGDVADAVAVAKAMDGVDACFHLAAVASVELGNRDWLGTHRTNLTGAITVFNAARRAKPGMTVPVVYASSAAVYGDSTELPLAETAVTRPLSAYGADKLGCELHGRVATRVHGVRTTGCRFFNVYGPRQDPGSPYSGVISIFFDRIRGGRGITIFGDGGQTRDFIYVADVVRAMQTIMANEAPEAAVFNVCTGQTTSLLELAAALGRVFGRTPDITFAAPRTGDIRESLGDPALAERTLGFKAQVSLEDGLRLMAEYATSRN
ncbi:MAG TPA: NAD-dependent epimerase/dehydratase family protein [Alphaproteobacteria bacterium]|nr:NAD-dependent epimerase/dehydratase family protein [Alphaproteobacteria bacterium]